MAYKVRIIQLCT